MYLGPPPKLDMYLKPIPLNKVVSVKYSSGKFACKENPPEIRDLLHYIYSFLDTGYSLEKDPNIAIDVKVHHLKIGQAPALLGWHTDINAKLDSNSQEQHFLFSRGDCSKTRFLKSNIYDLAQATAMEIESNTIYAYNRMHLHTAVPAILDGPRLFIRLSQIPDCRRVNKPLEPYIGSGQLPHRLANWDAIPLNPRMLYA